MTILLITAKIIASIFLLIFLVIAVLRANPQTHNPKYGHTAEYLTGFIFFAGALWGFYVLWLD